MMCGCGGRTEDLLARLPIAFLAISVCGGRTEYCERWSVDVAGGLSTANGGQCVWRAD
jgi:hypothetical protein